MSLRAIVTCGYCGTELADLDAVEEVGHVETFRNGDCPHDCAEKFELRIVYRSENGGNEEP